MANSQVPLKQSARGTEDRQLGTELCLLLGPTVILAACLPPRPFSALQPLAFWHSTFTHTGKIRNYYKPSVFHVVLKEKEKKTKQPNKKQTSRGCLTWDQLNWCLNNWVFKENFMCLNCFGSPPSHFIRPGQLPGMCCRWSLTILESGPISRQHLGEGIQFALQVLKQTSGASQVLLMPVLHLEKFVLHLDSKLFDLCHRD